MSNTYNRTIIIGRLGRDPELRFTQGGKPVCNMSLATDESYKDSDGNKVSKTEWHKVVVWNKQAESVANYLAKGRMVLVEGSLQTNKWQDNDGNNRATTEIKAQRVVFLSSGGKQQAEEYSSGTSTAPVFPSESSGMDDAPF